MPRLSEPDPTLLTFEELMKHTPPAHKPRVYIAGPMSGYPEWNRPAFDAAAAAWRAAGWVVFNPAEMGDYIDGGSPGSIPPADYLAYDLVVMVNTCRAIALLPGWDKSTGAVCEAVVAATLGFDFYNAETGEKIGTPLPILVTNGYGAPAVSPLEAP